MQTVALASIVTLTALALVPATARAEASATLRDASGKKVGEVQLRETPRGVLLHVQLEGLPPGKHAFHVHEHGRCEGTFDSAGGHFEPKGRAHGYLNPNGSHAGDLPNVVVSADGKADLEMMSAELRLASGSGELFDDDGAAVIVHAGPDDYASDPAGNAGGRIACGVLEP
jgi:Cu-Zn family superoxide dismutase